MNFAYRFLGSTSASSDAASSSFAFAPDTLRQPTFFTGKVARHNGIDIPAPHGTPIYATADGIVGRAQRLGGYGNYVEVEHGNAIQTRYGHMSSYIVTPGQQVKKGQILGYVGSTGRSTGNHLHYEVRIEGAPVNPMPFVRSDQMAIAAITGKNVAMGGPE